MLLQYPKPAFSRLTLALKHFKAKQLTNKMLKNFPESRKLLLLLKYFIKRIAIGDGEPGGISSFPLYLLVLHFFQEGFFITVQWQLGLPYTPKRPGPTQDRIGVETAVEDSLRSAGAEQPKRIAMEVSKYLFDDTKGRQTPPTDTRPHDVPIGQLLFHFCLYYGMIFDYDGSGIYFTADGESFVVEKPQSCRAREQHLHVSSPFDPSYDITARMAHTRELQSLCVGLVYVLNAQASLSSLLYWISPETLNEDIAEIYAAQHKQLLFYQQQRHQKMFQQYQQQLNLPGSAEKRPENEHPRRVAPNRVSAQDALHAPYVHSGYAPQYVFPTFTPVSTFQTACTPTSTMPSQGDRCTDICEGVQSTGTMTSLPQAPPLVPPSFIANSSCDPYYGNPHQSSFRAWREPHMDENRKLHHWGETNMRVGAAAQDSLTHRNQGPPNAAQLTPALARRVTPPLSHLPRAVPIKGEKYIPPHKRVDSDTLPPREEQKK